MKIKLTLPVALVAFLTGVYFLTYNGYAISRDEWFLFDATESMARRGNLRVNEEFDAYPPLSAAEVEPPSADTEPLQPMLAAPLFWIAQALPEIGLVHSVWLFNILITALTAAVLYAYGITLGYRRETALIVALVFGLGTMAWPYSRTFFREPLFTLLALSSTYLIMGVRRKLEVGQKPLIESAACGLVFVGALFSKEAALMILPVLLVEALPSRLSRVRLTRTWVVVLLITGSLVVGAGVVALNADTLLGLDPGRYQFSTRLQEARRNLSGIWIGIRGYLFSPARSVWLFSPVLLLGFLGWPRLIREKHWRQIAGPLVMLGMFVVGYAAVRGPDSWYGGLGWGPRYLVPVIPFLALWLLPVFEGLWQAAWWKRAAVLGVVVISLIIQILAALVPILRYYQTVEAQGIVSFSDNGAWSLRWSPLRVYPELIGDQKIDMAWTYAVGKAWLLPLLSVALVVAALGWLVWWHNHPQRYQWLGTGFLLGAVPLVLAGGLYGIHWDPRYYGDFEPTRALLDDLTAQVQPEDIIVLNDYEYSEFFMNYYKRWEPMIYTLPQSPGERFSPDQTPQVESPNPEALVHYSDTIIFADLAQNYERLWLVTNNSPFIAWAVRPVEHYLARHYFPIREIKSTDTARAVLFDLTSAPPATAVQWPEQNTSVIFGESLRLVGYDVPGGLTRRSGDVLPVSLLWETLAPPEQDYNVVLFLMDGDQVRAKTVDSFPVGGFEHTTQWRIGSLTRDNHGLELTLPPGDYELWAVVYWWGAPNDRLPVSNADGALVGDHALLGTVQIEP